MQCWAPNPCSISTLSIYILKPHAVTAACELSDLTLRRILSVKTPYVGKMKTGESQERLPPRTLTIYTVTTTATNSYILGHWGTHRHCWHWLWLKNLHRGYTAASIQNQSHHTLPNQHSKIHLQVKLFPYESHSVKFQRGDYSTRGININAGTRETWQNKETWHHQRNIIIL